MKGKQAVEQTEWVQVSPLSGQHPSSSHPHSHPQRQIGQHSTKYCYFFSVAFFLIFGFVLLFFDEDAFHDEKERTVASADCMLEELKVS